MIRYIISALSFAVAILTVIYITRTYYPIYKFYSLGFINVLLIALWIITYVITFLIHSKPLSISLSILIVVIFIFILYAD
jgi:hypothetical protein